MKHNLYKILRIIFLTLAIISLVFTLYKRITHAEGNATVGGKRVTYPIGYGQSSTQLYGKDGIDLTPVVNQFLSMNDGITVVTYDRSDENNPDIKYFHGYYQGSIFCNATSDVISPDNQFTIWVQGGRFDLGYNISTGQFLSGVGDENQCFLYQYATPVVLPVGVTEHYFIPQNIWIPGFPIWTSDNRNVYGSNDTLILQHEIDNAENSGGDSPISGSIIGSGTGSFISDSSGGDTSSGGSFDFDLELEFDDSGIINAIETTGNDIGGSIETIGDKIDSGNSKLDTITGSLQSFKSSIESKIDSFKTSVDNGLGDIRQKLSDIRDKIYQWFGYMTGSFNDQEFQSELDNMPLFQLVNQVEGNMATNLATFNTVTVTEPIFTFDVSGPLLGDNVSFTLDLTSYDDYRHLIVPLITLILTLTFVFSLFNDLPDLFHGHSGKDNVN